MDITPLLLRRWIFPLALALAALSLVGLLPQCASFDREGRSASTVRTPGNKPGRIIFSVSTNGDRSERAASLVSLHYVAVAVIGAFSALTILAERRGLDPRKLNFLLHASYVVLLFWMIVVLYGLYGNRNYHASAVILPMTSSVLAAAVPGLWASAVVRRTNPRDPEARAFGRLSAWIAVVSIVIGSLLSALESIALLRVYSELLMHPVIIIGSSSLTISRVLALWAAVETLRRSGTEEAVVARSRTIQSVMIAWLLLAVATQLYFTISGLLESDYLVSLVGLWRSVVYRLIMVLVAVLGAVHLERPGTRYNSASPEHP